MRRRDAALGLPSLLGLSLLAGGFPIPSTAQQRRTYRIGYLLQSPLTEPPSAERAAFLEELGKLGYVVGKNLRIEYRSAENTPEFLPDLAQELIKLDVDLMLVTGGAAAAAARAATSRLPIVLTQHADPVGEGLIKSLAKPGGNITGVSSVGRDLAGKRLQLLREVLPHAKKVSLPYAGYAGAMPRAAKASVESAATLKLALEPHSIESADALVQWFERIGRNRTDAVLVLADAKTVSYRDILVEQAARHRLPLFGDWPDLVRAGGLVSYSADFSALFRRAAHFVDKILRGAKPADLPVEQPTRFNMALNLRTARQLGLTIPQGILLHADEVIE